VPPPLIKGRVVRAEVPDPAGRNPKNRRCVVVEPPTGQPQRILIVGITTELDSSPHDHYVPLEWGPNCWSGLSEESAALCTWSIEIDESAVATTRHFIRPQYVLAILAKMESLKNAGFRCPCISL